MVRSRKVKAAEVGYTEPLKIPEDEQWRLIHESGILGRANPVPPREPVGDEDKPLAEEIFNSTVLIIPFSFLLLLMEILIHHQYGKQPSLKALVDRMGPGIPILSIFIFYTMRYRTYRKMQIFLFVLSVLVGTRMLYLVSRGPWLVNMRQCPPLATIWVYTIVQLDLGPAVLNLITVSSYVWWKGLEIHL